MNHIADLYSLHACVGLLGFILFAVQYMLGVLSFYFPKCNEQLRADFVPWHRYVGVVTFVFIYTALLTGILDR
jgi:cytochrome b-561